MRLDKFLSEAKVASRRELRTIIRAGRVQVDGITAKSPEEKVDENSQAITLDGVPVRLPGTLVLMLHKPVGYEYRRMGLKPVGRLDKDTEGLLLFTNDGALSHALTSPKHQVEKEYFAETEAPVDAADVEEFRAGITLRDGTVCLPAELIPRGTGCRVIVREGKYHQVRRMLASRGKPVTYLRREREGSLTLGELAIGTWRLLKPEEVQLLENKQE